MRLNKIVWTTATSLLVLVGAVTILPLRAIAGLETPCNYISDLVATNPLSSDLASTGDDHMRCIKLALKTSFPNISGAVTSDQTELNYLDGATGTTGTGNTVRSASPTFTGTIVAAGATLSDSFSFTKTYSSGNTLPISLASAVPLTEWDETDAAANNQHWYIGPNSEQFGIGYAGNDARTSIGSPAILLERTANTIDSITLQASTLFSTSWVSGNPGAQVSTSALPLVEWDESDAAANNRRWVTYASGEQYGIGAGMNDARTAIGSPAILIDRTANTIDTINFQATTVQLNGAALVGSTYTPSVTNTINVDSATAQVCQYMRVGNVVTVSGEVDIDPTSASQTVFELSLPISSNFSATNNVGGGGSANYSSSPGVLIRASSANDTAQFIYTAGATGSADVHFSFTYLVQ